MTTDICTLCGSAGHRPAECPWHNPNRTILTNARRIAATGFRKQPNWVLACELFGVGSTSAMKICRDAGIEPDSKTIEVK